MVNKILTRAGVEYKETRFLIPPKDTYAVYFDNVEVRGADYRNLIEEHSTTIELYEYEKDTDTESRIESQFNALGIEYRKEPRYWLETEQLYQVIYEFNYICKGETEDE